MSWERALAAALALHDLALMSGPTYKRAKAVVADATNESLPSDQREAAQQAAARMDATGKVTPA